MVIIDWIGHEAMLSSFIDLLIINNIGNSTMQVVKKANDPKEGVQFTNNKYDYKKNWTTQSPYVKTYITSFRFV